VVGILVLDLDFDLLEGDIPVDEVDSLHNLDVEDILHTLLEVEEDPVLGMDSGSPPLQPGHDRTLWVDPFSSLFPFGEGLEGGLESPHRGLDEAPACP